MFSLNNFYRVIDKHLLQPCALAHGYYLPFGSTRASDYYIPGDRGVYTENSRVVFFDQEPLLEHWIDEFFHKTSPTLRFPRTILANSELSPYKDKLCKDERFHDWYYFFHGFAALDWFKDYKYLMIDKSPSFSKVFINYNNLVTKDRSFRLSVASELLSRGLADKGYLSLSLEDKNGTWTQEVFDRNSQLSKDQKFLIIQTLKNIKEPLIIDKRDVKGEDSANIELGFNQAAFVHLVSETNFYHNKLHLTEKIFKPIVSYRPFILISYPGNLKYLRSYGFKTFSPWIDESYDEELDHELRIKKIIAEVEKLCNLTPAQQRELFMEMRPVLEHNFNHFYGPFKKIIVDEMVYGFGEVVHQTYGRIDDSAIDYNQVAKLLAS